MTVCSVAIAAQRMGKYGIKSMDAEI